MGSACCASSGNSEKVDNNDRRKPTAPVGEADKNEKSVGILYKGADVGQDTNDSNEKRLINDDKLKEDTFKAQGDDGYDKLKQKHSLTKKSQPDRDEYQLVKSFLAKKGYTLDASIGAGNYAEVFKAFNNSQKPVAVKVIDLKRATHHYRVDFLPAEVKLLSAIKHKNIIKMYEISQSANKVYMIMEFAPNGTLADWLKNKGSFSELTAHQMFVQILDAIHHMHSQHIAHRDLKLENILLTQKLNPKISDFSYAVEVPNKDFKSTTFCGSLPYFSPELLQKFPHNPLISDIWSLGVCFFIMLNDGLPFPLGDDRTMLRKQLAKEWRFRSKVSAKLSTDLLSFIKKMLEPNIKLRATSAQLMVDPWIQNFSPKVTDKNV
ncbi:testis-specific serine/threonine-protein kinase 3-like [Oppia nitens]|uniref:testis-specific serine/threonine-protein kinase 3-like n=1 Tax=Oppia nitens TaxID=1686743 RepID=UPI0023DC7362|nr:testis-specific serine/threonine-protein kinase 3-like [Oppia nitens]